MSKFEVNPDISLARTISTDFYLKAEYFESAKEKIFANTWHFIGDTDQVKEPGWVTPVNLLEKYLDEPLLLCRDKEGALHCLSNVCTHRGNLLVERPCKLNDIRCRYHGRRFQLDGRFLSMPEFKEVANFPEETDHLTKLPLFQFGKWLFTSLHPAQNGLDFFGGMMERVGWMPFEDFHFRPELSHDYTVDAHWALYCENYLEGFHIPFVHAGLNAVLDFGNYVTELFPYSNLQLGIAKDGEDVFELPVTSPDFGKQVGAYYFFVFPNMMFNFYPWGLSINIVKPVSQQQCKVSFLTYIWKEELFNRGAGSDLNQVEIEDEEVVEAVQKGIRSRFYSHGRYSVSREQGTHHFHRIISEMLSS